MTHVEAPSTEQELLARAKALAQRSLGSIARELGWPVPVDFRREKGWVGKLVEAILGAPMNSAPEPDFLHLGIELKTLPLSSSGQPKESTFVCVASLTGQTGVQWADSLVRKKLQSVLWVPYQAESAIAPADRCIGSPFLWRPTASFEQILREDWEAAMDKIALGELDTLSAEEGKYLQVRPKAAHARSQCWGFNEWGEKVRTLPRGFYLRSLATKLILYP